MLLTVEAVSAFLEILFKSMIANLLLAKLTAIAAILGICLQGILITHPRIFALPSTGTGT